MNTLIEKMKEMRFKNKMTYKSIADELNCSLAKVYYSINKRKETKKSKQIKKPKVSKKSKPNINHARDNKILQMRHVEKMTYDDIGQHFNISKERVRQILKRLNADGKMNSRKGKQFKKYPKYNHPSLNSRIFNIIDSQDKAYYLGVLLQKLVSDNEFNRNNFLVVFRFTNTQGPMIKEILSFLNIEQDKLTYDVSEFYPTLYIYDETFSNTIYKYFDYAKEKDFFIPNEFIKDFFAGIIYYSYTFIKTSNFKPVYKIDFSFRNKYIIDHIFKQVYLQTGFDLSDVKGFNGPKTNIYQINRTLESWKPFIQWIPIHDTLFPNLPKEY